MLSAELLALRVRGCATPFLTCSDGLAGGSIELVV